MRGRYPSGLEFVDKLNSSPESKQRLKAILETMAGTCRTQEACERLGISEQRFDQIRVEALQAALAALEPKPAGRKPRQPTPEEIDVEYLQEQIAKLKAELQAALIRAEIAVALPQAGAADQKKNDAARFAQAAPAEEASVNVMSEIAAAEPCQAAVEVVAVNQGDERRAAPEEAAVSRAPEEAVVNPSPDHHAGTEQVVNRSEQRASQSCRAATEELVVNHLRERLTAEPVAEGPPRRGFAGQRHAREQEQIVRRHTVEVGRRIMEELGRTQRETAELFNLPPRTLRQWLHDFEHDLLQPRPLGRPILAATREERNQVLRIIDELGPRIGVPTLRAMFPDLARAELEHLLQRYRCVWRRLNEQSIHVLHWPNPGSVWAIDFHGPRARIDGLYPYLLAVRDLASGQQLVWRPVRDTTAEAALAQMQMLIANHGAPLVLKSDNGSAFIAELFRDGLKGHHVEILFSPPRMPSYNGSIEAGIGSLTSRTEQHAARRGHPGHWTWDDTEAALHEANATTRPFGLTGPSPDAVWSGRTPITQSERTRFRETVATRRQEVLDAQGWPLTTPQDAASQRATDRDTISRVLVELGYLHYTRRRIALPIRTKKAAKIM